MKNRNLLHILLGIVIAVCLIELSFYSYKIYSKLNEEKNSCKAILTILDEWEVTK